MEFISESSYDILRGKSLKVLAKTRHLNKQINQKRETLLNKNLDKVALIKKTIEIETNRLIVALQQNHNKLMAEASFIEKKLKKSFSKCVIHPELIAKSEETKNAVENNKFDDHELLDLNEITYAFNESLDSMLDGIEMFDQNLDFALNESINLKDGLIGEITSKNKLFKQYFTQALEMFNSEKSLADSLSLFDKAIEICPWESKGYFHKGKALKKAGEISKAIDCFKKCIELSPKSWTYRHFTGLALMEQNKFDQAVEYFAKACELIPNRALSHYHLSIAYKSDGQLDQSLACIDMAIKLDPENLLFQNEKSAQLIDQHKYKQAFGNMGDLIKSNPRFFQKVLI